MSVLDRRTERYRRHLPQCVHLLLLGQSGRSNDALTVTEPRNGLTPLDWDKANWHTRGGLFGRAGAPLGSPRLVIPVGDITKARSLRAQTGLFLPCSRCFSGD